MSQHTPGPWSVGSAATCSVWKGDEQIASCQWTLEDGEPDYMAGRDAFNPREVREANARLIAAAPAMKEALHKIAYEPFGASDASHAEALDAITTFARLVLAQTEPPK